MVFYDILTTASAQHYKSMTFPAYRGLLDTLDEDGSLFAIGAHEEGHPVGLGLLSFEGEEATLLSLYIVPQMRHKGFGGGLLSALEECAETLRVTFSDRHKDSLEPLFAKHGWSTPEQIMKLYYYDPATVIRSEMATPIRLSEPYSMQPYARCSAFELKDIEAIHALPSFPKELSICKPEVFPVHNETSFVLKREGRVIGWVVTHMLSKRLVRYTSLYVRPEYEKKGIGVALMKQAAARHCHTDDLKGMLAVQGIPKSYEAMTRLAEKRLASWAYKEGAMYASSKAR